MNQNDGLKQKVVAAGGILTIRNLIAAAISISGNIVIVRYLGLELYGLQSVSAFFASVLMSVAEFSIGLFVLRFSGDIDDRRLNTAGTLLLLFSAGAALIGCLILAPLLGWWYRNAVLPALMIASSIGIVVSAFGKIPLILIERQMNYRKVSFIELIGLFAYYGPAIIGSLFGLKVWSLVIAEIAKPLAICILALVLNPRRLHLSIDRGAASEIFKYGLPASLSGWIWMISGALNPILIGKVIGLEAAGLVRLVQGIINQFSFFVNILSRLSINVLGKLQDERERALRAINQSAIFSYFLVTFPMFAFACIGSWAIPFIYGNSSAEAARLFVFMIVPQAINMIFTGQTYLLMAVGRNSQLVKLHVIRSILIWSLCALLVSKLKIYSIPAAEILVLPVYYILHFNVRSLFGRPSYRDPAILFLSGYSAVILSLYIMQPVWSISVFLLSSIIGFMLISRESLRQILEIVSTTMRTVRPSWLVARQSQL